MKRIFRIDEGSFSREVLRQIAYIPYVVEDWMGPLLDQYPSTQSIHPATYIEHHTMKEYGMG